MLERFCLKTRYLSIYFHWKIVRTILIIFVRHSRFYSLWNTTESNLMWNRSDAIASRDILKRVAPGLVLKASMDTRTWFFFFGTAAPLLKYLSTADYWRNCGRYWCLNVILARDRLKKVGISDIAKLRIANWFTEIAESEIANLSTVFYGYYYRCDIGIMWRHLHPKCKQQSSSMFFRCASDV